MKSKLTLLKSQTKNVRDQEVKVALAQATMQRRSVAKTERQLAKTERQLVARDVVIKDLRLDLADIPDIVAHLDSQLSLAKLVHN